MGIIKKSLIQRSLFFVFFLFSFLFIFTLKSYACTTPADCGSGVWECVSGHCIAQCNAQNGTFCHTNSCIAPAVPASGWCPSTEVCCRSGAVATKYSCVNGSCSTDPNGTYSDQSSCQTACTSGNPSESGGAYPTKPICLGRYVSCSPGTGPSDTADPNGIYCCPGLSCQYAGNSQEGGQPHPGPISYVYQCDTPPSEQGDTSCAADGSWCDTAFGRVYTTGAGITKALFSVLLSISGALAVLLIIISGYRMMTSQGNPERLQAAREQLIAAIVGLLFIIFSLVILQTIGVDLLGLSGFSP